MHSWPTFHHPNSPNTASDPSSKIHWASLFSLALSNIPRRCELARLSTRQRFWVPRGRFRRLARRCRTRWWGVRYPTSSRIWPIAIIAHGRFQRLRRLPLGGWAGCTRFLKSKQQNRPMHWKNKAGQKGVHTRMEKHDPTYADTFDLTPPSVIFPLTFVFKRSAAATRTSSLRTWYWLGPSMCSLKISVAILLMSGCAIQVPLQKD